MKNKFRKSLFVIAAFMALCGVSKPLEASVPHVVADIDTVYWDYSFNSMADYYQDATNFNPDFKRNPAYELVINSVGTVIIDLKSKAADTWLFMFDRNGNYITDNDDDSVFPGESDSRIVLTNRAPGTYKLMAGTYDEGSVGVGEIFVTGDAKIQPHNVVWSNSGGDLDPMNVGNPNFTLVLDKPGNVQIDLKTTYEVDAYLYFVNTRTGATYEDDDGEYAQIGSPPLSRDSRWYGYLEAGTYRIFAGTYDPGKFGTGRLEVSRGDLVAHNEDTYFDMIVSPNSTVPYGYTLLGGDDFWIDQSTFIHLAHEWGGIEGENMYIRYTNIRKPAHEFSSKEWDCFEHALMALKRLENNTANGELSYDGYVLLHDPAAHEYTFTGNDRYLAWHREYLRIFENGLQRICPTVTIPFWDYVTDDNMPARLKDTADSSGKHKWLHSPTDLFFGNTTTAYDTWDEYDFYRWYEDLGGAPHIENSLIASQSKANFYDFRHSLENGIDVDIVSALHGIFLTQYVSPYDPIFWLHHAMIDYQWAIWQEGNNGIRSHQAPYYLSLKANIFYGPQTGTNMFEHTGYETDNRNLMGLGYVNNGVKH